MVSGLLNGRTVKIPFRRLARYDAAASCRYNLVHFYGSSHTSRLRPALFSFLCSRLFSTIPGLTKIYCVLSYLYYMDQETKNEFVALRNFLQENMVTKQELQDLREELPTREDFSQLQTSVDGIAKHFQEQRQEQTIGASRTSRMEAWIIKAASKIGVEYKP
jgi:hypothetical protein